MNTRKSLVSVLMLVSILLSACAPAATPSPVPTAIPPTAVRPTTVPSNQTTFHSSENASFRLPLAFSYSHEWDVQVGINALDIIHKGNPLEPQSAWWGPSIFLVNGAQVADPKDGITKIPWPEDFFAYVSSFPTVKVIQGPDQVTIGGIEGKQMIIHTSTGRCFGLWLKDDFTWLGIGSNCGDGKSQIILLDVNGEQVLLWFPESPEKFDERYLLVQEIFNSITFGK